MSPPPAQKGIDFSLFLLLHFQEILLTQKWPNPLLAWPGGRGSSSTSFFCVLTKEVNEVVECIK